MINRRMFKRSVVVNALFFTSLIFLIFLILVPVNYLISLPLVLVFLSLALVMDYKFKKNNPKYKKYYFIAKYCVYAVSVCIAMLIIEPNIKIKLFLIPVTILIGILLVYCYIKDPKIHKL